MWKRLGWFIVGVLVVLPIAGGIALVKLRQFDTMAAAGANFVMPPETVNVAEVMERQWRPRLASVGTVMAFQGTVIRSEAEGVVREVRFRAGSRVEAGDVLLVLDSEVEAAELRAAEASRELARLSYQRARDLVASRSISQADVDLARASLNQAGAEVDGLRARLARKTVRAPFAGRLGIRQVSTGQFLEKGAAVVSLQSLDPVYVEFSLPQQQLGLLQQGLQVEVATDAHPGAVFPGELTAIHPEVDRATRNVRIQATLANPDELLRPGMFVSAEVLLARTEQALFIPATAVQHAPFGDTVFVVEPGEAGADGEATLVLRQQLVRLGIRRGDYVAVTEGLRAGERVVSTGVFKLSPGMKVVIDNSLAPDFSFEPRPRNT